MGKGNSAARLQPKVSYSIQNFIISVTYPDDEEEGGDDEEGREPSDDKL